MFDGEEPPGIPYANPPSIVLLPTPLNAPKAFSIFTDDP